jgi:LCP family protein required for cell wall assembly
MDIKMVKLPKIKFTRQNIILSLICAAVFFVGLFSTYFLLKFSKSFNRKSVPTATPFTSENEKVNFPPAPEIIPTQGVYNTVLLGYGGGGHSGALLTDSIIVIHVNTNDKTAALISIPRDLWVNGNHKINAEASINGFANMGGVIKNVTGLPVDYFAAIDFSGFSKLIDNLGGIDVNVPIAFDDPYYPVAGLENETCGKSAEEIEALKAKYSDYQLEIQFTCRYERVRYDKGPAKLDGTAALKFVRSRHGDSDFSRSPRQFAVLRGILAKLIALNALDKTNQTIDGIIRMVKTNLGLTNIKSFIEVVGDTGQYKITEIRLTTDNLLTESRSQAGAYILNPKAGVFNFTEIKNYISGSI